VVLVSGSDRNDLRGSCAYSPWEITKGNSSGLLMAYGSLFVLVLTAPKCWARRVMPISM
jgi:hypothetical protein